MNWWLSSSRMTVGVQVIDGIITDGAPIIQRFVGQPLGNLIGWMKKQGNFRIHKFK